MKEVIIEVDQQASDVVRIYRERGALVMTRHMPIMEEREKVLYKMKKDEAMELGQALIKEAKKL